MTETLSAELPPELQRAVHDLLRRVCDEQLRLATAESCTGGLLASVLTDVEGCSHAFDRGFVVYSEAAKKDVLGLGDDLLARHGAVSRPAAIAMAEAALRRSRADVAFAVTGFAGPAGHTDEEGLVHYACARAGRETLHREAHHGAIGRGPIRIRCLAVAVDMIGRMIRP